MSCAQGQGGTGSSGPSLPPAPMAVAAGAAAAATANAASSTGATAPVPAGAYNYQYMYHGYYGQPYHSYAQNIPFQQPNTGTTQMPSQQQLHGAIDDATNEAAGNLSSMKKSLPLKTITDNPADQDGNDEFGGLSGRKLDQSFASEPDTEPEAAVSSGPGPAKKNTKPSEKQPSTASDALDGPTRAPTPLLLAPDQSVEAKQGGFLNKALLSSDGGNTADVASTASPRPLPSSKLAELDAMACQNLEAFQATLEDVNAFDSSAVTKLCGDSTVSSISCGLVGFRCVHCFSKDNVTRNANICVVYPPSVGTISSALRLMRDRHFPNCKAMSEGSSSAFADARRKQEEEDAARGGSDGGGSNEESRRIAFLDFCVDFCKRKGIVNMPQRSGIEYAGTMDVSPRTSKEKKIEITSVATPGNPNFPFFSDGYGAWICKYCCSVPYPYRGAGSVWNAPNQAPPTKDFVDQHMNVCRGASYGLPPHSANRKGLPAPHTPNTPNPNGATASPAITGTTPQPPPLPPHLPKASPLPQVPTVGGAHPSFYSQHLPYPPGYVRPGGLPPGLPRPGQSQRGRGSKKVKIPEKLVNPPGVDGSGSDCSVQAAIDYLVAAEASAPKHPPSTAQIELIVGEDKLLLTDYFYHLIRQLRLVRFSERDRKTRGGKREKVAIGYGGLECVHCSGVSTGRKFFWSNVDRLANSFAEIPGHVLKCRHCPQQTKAALLELKLRHSAQMSKLPRGSQKVFFRRMWRRIHEGDNDPNNLLPQPPSASNAESVASGTAPKTPSSSIGSQEGTPSNAVVPPLSAEKRDKEPPPTPIEQSASQSLASLAGVMRTPISSRATRSSKAASGDATAVATSNVFTVIGEHEHIGVSLTRARDGSSESAARALAHSAASHGTGIDEAHPIIMLAIKEDGEWLSDNDCFIRRNIEVFTATEKDVLTAKADRKQPVKLGQIGIRCVHCAVAVSRYSEGKRGARGAAVAFPNSIGGIYESVREMHRLHLDTCPHLPNDVREKLSVLKGSKSSSSLSSVLRRYYVMAAKALGMVDSKEGIKAGGDVTSLASSAENDFAKSTGPTISFPKVPVPGPSPLTSTPAPRRQPQTEGATFSGGNVAASGGGSDYIYQQQPPHSHPHSYSQPQMPHYGYHYNYGPATAGVPGTFLTSAITPLESRKRKAPREETPQSTQTSSKKHKLDDNHIGEIAGV